MREKREFHGRSMRDAKRRALNYWYQNRVPLGLTLSEFLRGCRVRQREGETRIIYDPGDGPRVAA